MKIGLQIDHAQPLKTVVQSIVAAEDLGYATAWVNEGQAWDPLAALTVAGLQTTGIELGTAVVQIYPRHPLILAGQALTLQAALGNRLVLGLGTSHPRVIEQRYGMAFDRPGRQMSEFLDVLVPVLSGQAVEVRGEVIAAVGGLAAAGTPTPSVLVGAHGPKLLTLAGEQACGAITFLAGPDFVASYVVPRVMDKADLDRPPRIVVAVQAVLTCAPDQARARLAAASAGTKDLPSYRGSLERQSVNSAADLMLAGDEQDLEKAVRRYAEAGASDLIILATGTTPERERTLAFFGDLSRRNS